jgi:hypothetical protein
MHILRFIEAEDFMLAKNHIGLSNFSPDFHPGLVAPRSRVHPPWTARIPTEV